MSEFIINMGSSSYQSTSGLLCADVSQLREEIVRCRDCKYKRKSWNGKRPDFIPDGFFCAYWGGHELWKPDGFCAWGERKEVSE